VRCQAIREANAHIASLPLCSPDLNPIEQVFANIRHWMRKAQALAVTQSTPTLQMA